MVMPSNDAAPSKITFPFSKYLAGYLTVGSKLKPIPSFFSSDCPRFHALKKKSRFIFVPGTSITCDVFRFLFCGFLASARA